MENIETRYKKITQIVEAGRMHATRREDMGRPQLGILVKDEVTVWGDLPEDPAEDEKFALDLLEKAKLEASRP